jgi:hypothetical protein
VADFHFENLFQERRRKKKRERERGKLSKKKGKMFPSSPKLRFSQLGRGGT